MVRAVRPAVQHQHMVKERQGLTLLTSTSALNYLAHLATATTSHHMKDKAMMANTVLSNPTTANRV